ncbi:ferrous iron transport protein A [Streptomyces sp. NPDC004065]|uniref:FeoA family protein n=1 Tax=Streptomyces sp. NPDC004065 TaxID=3364689 RepID=UPI00384A4F14
MNGVDAHGGRESGAVATGVLAAAPPGAVALADLAPGARAVVAAVAADGTPSVARRLGDLGFTPGAEVEVVRRAPLRDPVVYRVKDYEVCLRRAEAARVRVVGVRR